MKFTVTQRRTDGLRGKHDKQRKRNTANGGKT